ncbi:MAG: hypothetical protein JXB33_08835 [Clostridia bacterium]|nr:hypothetical protein [Clostridia bacterium]
MASTPRENLLSLYKKTGYSHAPVSFELCPLKVLEYRKKTGEIEKSYTEYFDFPEVYVSDLEFAELDRSAYLPYFKNNSNDIRIDKWGIGYEKGSEACAHMEHFLHPMKDFTTLGEFEEYPYPAYLGAGTEHLKKEADAIHSRGYAAKASMACTVWEIAWYLRSMEQLMSDMILDKDLAEYHLDRITEISCHRATAFAEAGVDIILTGDDVGMQDTLMMSEAMYCEWIKPRFAKILAAAKNANPGVLIEYHSCGYVEPLIPHFIECGIDILNPIQPECMDFRTLFKRHGHEISFKGTVGIQTTMPFGTPDDVRSVVKKNLDLAGPAGGLFCCPTHMIEPEVPWENIEAYVDACRSYTP